MAMLNISTEEEFQNEVINSKTPVVVDFYADWCSPCKAIMPVLEELSRERDLKVVKINIENPLMVGVVQGHGISSIPALFIYNKGQKIDSAIGSVDKNILSSKIP